MAFPIDPRETEENPAVWNADTTLRKEDYFRQYLDGTPSPNDVGQEPELGHRLTKLYERQRDEAYDFLEAAKGRINPDGEEAAFHRTHKAEFRAEFREECERFAKERDRHIREYHNAKTILAEMNEGSREQTLDQQLDQNQKQSF